MFRCKNCRSYNQPLDDYCAQCGHPVNWTPMYKKWPEGGWFVVNIPGTTVVSRNERNDWSIGEATFWSRDQAARYWRRRLQEQEG